MNPQTIDLIWLFVKRDILNRYKGAFLGVGWTLLSPLFLLLLYTFVFSIILGVRFRESNTIPGYSLYLFCGFVPWLAFSDTLGRSPGLILAQANLVKRVLFPVQIIPLVATISGLFQGFCALAILVMVVIFMKGQFLSMSLLYLPLVVLIQALLTLGLSWLISSAGVFIRDLSEIMRIVLTAWMFMTPIMYPIDMIPDAMRNYLYVNPMTIIVEGYRAVILRGVAPEWIYLGWGALLSVVVCVIGYECFRRTRGAFADVL